MLLSRKSIQSEAKTGNREVDRCLESLVGLLHSEIEALEQKVTKLEYQVGVSRNEVRNLTSRVSYLERSG